MTDQPSDGLWFIPAHTVKLPDGSTLVKPGKAIRKASLTATVKLTGVPRRILNALAECGLITREKPSPLTSNFYPGEVQELLRKTAEDPTFWNEVRLKAYLNGSSLKNARPK
jgi:hypothetical protein